MKSDGVYLRLGATNKQATRDDIIGMKRVKRPEYNFEVIMKFLRQVKTGNKTYYELKNR